MSRIYPSKNGRMYPDSIVSKTTHNTMSGIAGYTKVISHSGTLGYRKDLINEDMKSFY